MLELAKTKGLSAVRKFLHTYDTDYKLVLISSKTLGMLLMTTFKSFNEVLDFDVKTRGNRNVELLIKEEDKTNFIQVRVIIEAIFFLD